MPPRPENLGVVPLDVEHDGLPGVICAYLLEEPEPTIVDPGPSTSLPTLFERLEKHGVPPEDLRHLLLTHIHLDHAGGAGQLVRKYPEITVHVHEEGASHLTDPTRLVASTRRTFGDAHDRLWGEVLPIPGDRIRAWREGDSWPLPRIRPIPTPGHIGHHLAWEAEGHGVLFTGDVMGVILHPDTVAHPPTPPPAVDLEAWRRTLDKTLAPIDVEAFAPTHFGLHGDFHDRRRELRAALDRLVERVREAMIQGEAAEQADRDAYDREVRGELDLHFSAEWVERYLETFAPRTDWDGVRFHLARTERFRDDSAAASGDGRASGARDA